VAGSGVTGLPAGPGSPDRRPATRDRGRPRRKPHRPVEAPGPFTHENLTIFLIHGKERLKGRPLLTLQEALAQKKVVVHETGQVNQMAVENVSGDSEVFIQAGGIVKGGQQAQDKLGAALGYSVQAPASASSLQLTLEDKRVGQTADGYVRALSGAPTGQSDVIGYAFAVNGRVNSAEVYASGDLFRKLWPKLLKASAVEAVAELEKGKRFDAVSAPSVKAFLADAERGAATEQAVGRGNRAVTQETEENLLFETRDRKEPGAWIHRSYVVK
jgi:hypothetical protein